MPIRLPLFALLVMLLTGCAAVSKSEQNLLEDTLDTYSSVIRWSNFEEAVTFIDPATLKAHPISKLDLERLNQVRVTSYNAQPARNTGEHEVRQIVEIGLVNVNTQSARSVIDRQAWRFDAKEKRWWLVSGLPDITVR
jgi:hypothetical protein